MHKACSWDSKWKNINYLLIKLPERRETKKTVFEKNALNDFDDKRFFPSCALNIYMEKKVV